MRAPSGAWGRSASAASPCVQVREGCNRCGSHRCGSNHAIAAAAITQSYHGEPPERAAQHAGLPLPLRSGKGTSHGRNFPPYRASRAICRVSSPGLLRHRASRAIYPPLSPTVVLFLFRFPKAAGRCARPVGTSHRTRSSRASRAICRVSSPGLLRQKASRTIYPPLSPTGLFIPPPSKCGRSREPAPVGSPTLQAASRASRAICRVSSPGLLRHRASRAIYPPLSPTGRFSVGTRTLHAASRASRAICRVSPPRSLGQGERAAQYAGFRARVC